MKVLLTILLIGCFSPCELREAAQSSKDLAATPHAPAPRKLCSSCPERVSMIQLIATPERFDGHMVLIEGYSSLQFEEYAVYFSRADYDDFNSENGLWISFADKMLKSAQELKGLQGKLVVLEGTFSADCYGHLGSYPGCVQEITRIERMPNRNELENRGRPSGKK